MKTVKSKFDKLIKRLNYANVQLSTIDVTRIRAWCLKHMPKVVEELVSLGWDLEDRDTWLETVFVNTPMQWYGNNIGLYVTSSYTDYVLAKKVIKTPTFKKFRKDFNIDCHAVILFDPLMFIKAEDLDEIYLSFDFDKGYSFLDFSYYDDEDNLIDSVSSDWGWLTAEGNSEFIDDPENSENYYDVELWDEYKQKMIREEVIYE